MGSGGIFSGGVFSGYLGFLFRGSFFGFLFSGVFLLGPLFSGVLFSGCWGTGSKVSLFRGSLFRVQKTTFYPLPRRNAGSRGSLLRGSLFRVQGTGFLKYCTLLLKQSICSRGKHGTQARERSSKVEQYLLHPFKKEVFAVFFGRRRGRKDTAYPFFFL